MTISIDEYYVIRTTITDNKFLFFCLYENHDLDQIVSQGRQLFSQCDGQTSLKINEITHRIQQQWTNIEQRLQEIIRPSREIVDYWRQFNSSYVHLLDRLDYLNELIEIINQIQIDYKSQQLTDENEINNLKQLHQFHRLLLSKHDLIEHLNSNEFI
ncbi:unnamed protein product [Rotaria sordida]|uniref:Uncharacterized protein n=1 Tax=Rotaria sordida TaxID=392033 RepID=A0A816F2U3_9BILA|nr:unnamed protein product [Rotaria sordida]CAF1654004.1 unnamed protein product [Rotaria sordida]